MQHRPLTEQEYAIAGLPLDICTSCKCRSLQKPYQWVYYRENGVPKILCDSCFTDRCEHGTIADAAIFASPQATACEWPQDAYSVIGLPQVPPDAVNEAFDKFRELSPEDIRGLSLSIPTRAGPGHRLEWFGPVRWWAVLWCLAWLREIHALRLPFVFGRWEKLPSLIADKLQGIDHEPWRQRLTAFAREEFLFRYSELLSDAVGKAHRESAKKKTVEHKLKVFTDIVDATCKHAPPESLGGASEDLQRFIEYMNAQTAEYTS
jgi:hypothetical protein